MSNRIMQDFQHIRYSKRIANYLYNDMSNDERIAFEEDLLIDSELASEYGFQAEIVNYLKAKTKLEELRSNTDLKEAERIAEDIFDPESDHRRIPVKSKSFKDGFIKYRYFLIGAAAAFIAICIVSRMFYVANLNDRLYNSYYEPFNEANFTIRSTNSIEQANLANAIGLYQNRSYEEASELLMQLTSDFPDSPEPYFFLGLSKIGEKEYSEAVGIFNFCLTHFSKYKPEIQWYLSLCYLKLENISEAEKELRLLVNMPGIMGENSRKLLRKLH